MLPFNPSTGISSSGNHHLQTNQFDLSGDDLAVEAENEPPVVFKVPMGYDEMHVPPTGVAS